MLTAFDRILQTFAITIIAATAAPGQDSADDVRYRIIVGTPIKILFSDRIKLNKPCGTQKLIFGCTLFGEEHLSCSCERRGQRWRLLAEARFVPIMYLQVARPDVVDHEQLHIADVHKRLSEYLRRLTFHEFTTQDRCAKAAGAASDDTLFARRMNDFRRQSAQALDWP